MEQTAIPIEQSGGASRKKFLIGGLLILAGIVFLIISSTRASAQYFMTVEELAAKGSQVIGRDLRVSGAVIGDSI
jgi:cytochrome c-type biogenesis protein CcmE